MKKFEVSKMFPSLCISNVSKVVGCEWDVLRPRVQSLSVGCLVILSSCPRVLSTRTLGSCPAFWQLFPQRAGIYSLKLRLLRSDCENIDSSLESLMWIPEFHLPFRIPPLLSATSRFFTCFPSLPCYQPSTLPHPYHIWTSLSSLETMPGSPDYPCWIYCSFMSLFNKSFLILSACQPVHFKCCG